MEDDDDFEDWLIAREECIMDLDNDELEATRKLNGVAKESNIEIIEDFINEIKDFELNKDTVEIVNALEYVLEEREADKKRIKELEDDLYSANCIISDLTDSIPVQKVKDLKESIILEPTIVGGRRNAKTLEYGIKLGKIKACEELLEDK